MIIIKGIKIAITILIIIVILIGGMYYTFTPDKKINFNNSDCNIITTEELLKGNFIESFNILTDPIRLDGVIAVSNDEFRDIIYTVMTNYNYNTGDLKYSNITLHNNYIKVIMPYKLLNIIDTQYEFNIYPTLVDNNLHLNLREFKIGKLKLSNKIVQSILKENISNLPFDINNNVIIIDKIYMEPVTLKDINVEDNKIIVNISVSALDIIEFIGEYNSK